jgi:hypothetical protein
MFMLGGEMATGKLLQEMAVAVALLVHINVYH